jgi:hypothetical protein
VAKEIQGPADQKLLQSSVVLGPYWALGPSWAMLGCLGAMLGPSWAVLSHLGAILGTSLAMWGSSWAILRSCWPSWGYVGPSWGRFGHLGVPSWWIWRTSHAFWGVLGVNLAILGCHLGRFEGPPTRFGDPAQFSLWAGKVRQHGRFRVLAAVFGVWGVGGKPDKRTED